MEIIELAGKDLIKWDELVASSRHGTIFNSVDWLNIYKDTMNRQIKIFGCVENDTLVGGCPLFISDHKFYRIASSVAEMMPYGGVVLSESPRDSVRNRELWNREIIKCLTDAIDKEKCHLVTLTNAPEFEDIRPFTWNGWDGQVLYTYYMDLKEYPDNRRKGLRKKIRRTEGNGIRTKKINDVSVFYGLFLDTFARQNLKPPCTQEYFEHIIGNKAKKPLGEMWVAELPTGEPVATEIILKDNKRVYRWAAASRNDHINVSAAALLLDEIFHDLIWQDYSEIYLSCGNTPQFAQFISQFSPMLAPYYSVRKISPGLNFIKELNHIVHHGVRPLGSIKSRFLSKNEPDKVDTVQ
jgi:hypothetical protein